jgi:hypothetical protein
MSIPVNIFNPQIRRQVVYKLQSSYATMSSVDLFKHTITIILAENWLFNFAFKVSFSVNIQITKQPKGEMLIINKKTA